MILFFPGTDHGFFLLPPKYKIFLTNVFLFRYFRVFLFVVYLDFNADTLANVTSLIISFWFPLLKVNRSIIPLADSAIPPAFCNWFPYILLFPCLLSL